MNGYFLTDKGQVRTHNEDAGGLFYNLEGQCLAVIADGMGGHNAGDVASQMATSMLSKAWNSSSALLSPGEAEQWLAEKINEANRAILEYATDHEECKGMGTTIVAAVCVEEFITIAHIGDSRCYLANEEGFKQITEDHSLVNELVRSGQISREDAEHHPRKNVLLKALGTEGEVRADIQSIEWESNDKLLLCSDGLSNKFNDNEIYEIIQSTSTLADTAGKLVTVANDRGGEDNISIVLVDHRSWSEEGVS